MLCACPSHSWFKTEYIIKINEDCQYELTQLFERKRTYKLNKLKTFNIKYKIYNYKFTNISILDVDSL